MSIMEGQKLRSDLVVSRQPQKGQVIFVIKDPVNSQYFRLNEPDYFIAAQLDGCTGLETVRQRTEATFNVRLSPQSLAEFIISLRQSNLLESAASETVLPRERRRLGGSLLYLRFKLFDPDALFSWLVKRIGFCFSPGFVACAAATILWALILAVANWDAFRQDLLGLIRWNALIWLLAAMLAVSMAHEFAHGLTCKHFGGEVRELGVLLLYFQPAFYCNVSDAWLFAEKSKRLWVGFAGPYFEFFLWACAVLVWRVTDGETWLNFGAVAVMAVSGIKTLLNFNPLIKLDGYYLLSDLLDMPNLRRRAYAYIGDAIKGVLGLERTARAEIPPRERRACLAYGLAAAVFSFSLLGFAIAKFGGYLIGNRHPEALILATGLLGMKIRRRFRRLFGKSPDPSKPEDSSVAEAPPEPSDLPIPEAPLKPNSAPEDSRPARRKHKRRVIFAVCLGIALPVLFFARMELRISGPFTLQPIQNADVRPEVGGTIEEVFVDEGDSVRAGGLIARLSDRDNRTALLRTEADIAQLQAQLRLLQAGPRPEEIELARIGVTRAEERHTFAEKNLERDAQLLQEQLISRKDYETSEQAVVESKTDLAEAKNRLRVLLAGSRPEEIEAAKAGIDRLETQRRYIEEQLDHAKVTSPVDGVVVTPSRELKELIGNVVKEGDLIAKVHELNTVELETPVSEKDIADVKLGQKVALKVRAYPEQTFYGTVTSIGTAVQSGATTQTTASGTSTSPAPGAASTSARTVLVTTRIPNENRLLKPGMTGMVKIFCGDHPILDLLTRRLARTIKVEFWSWW